VGSRRENWQVRQNSLEGWCTLLMLVIGALKEIAQGFPKVFLFLADNVV
jgi:hypothetical protein